MLRQKLEAIMDNAIANLRTKCNANIDGHVYGFRRLYPVSSWQPFEHGSSPELVAIGEDDCGNYFLYSPEGSILFWDHETNDETLLGNDLGKFLDSLSGPISVDLKPGQVIRAWIDPEFLEEQRRKGNAI